MVAVVAPLEVLFVATSGGVLPFIIPVSAELTLIYVFLVITAAVLSGIFGAVYIQFTLEQ